MSDTPLPLLEVIQKFKAKRSTACMQRAGCISMQAPWLSVHAVRHYEPCLANSLGSVLPCVLILSGSYNPSFLQQQFPEFCLISGYGSVHLLLSAAGGTSLRTGTHQ